MLGASENFGVARVQREVINEDSQVGGIPTSRLGRDGTYDLAYGLDGLFRIEGQQYVTAKWARTFRDGLPNRVPSLDPTRVHLRWEDRAYEGLRYSLRYDRAGSRYRPGVGLELRKDCFRLGDRIGDGWVPGEASSIQRHRLNLEGETYFRHGGGTLQSPEVGPEWEMTSNAGHSLTLEGTRRVEDLQGPFPLAEGAEVPAAASTTGGRATAQASPIWNASRYLRLSGFYQLNRIRFPERGQQFTAHLGRLWAEGTPGIEYSVSAFVQYNSARGAVIGNLRFRYNPRQGTDLYLVYNERLNTDRAVLLKYSYTFNW